MKNRLFNTLAALMGCSVAVVAPPQIGLAVNLNKEEFRSALERRLCLSAAAGLALRYRQIMRVWLNDANSEMNVEKAFNNFTGEHQSRLEAIEAFANSKFVIEGKFEKLAGAIRMLTEQNADVLDIELKASIKDRALVKSLATIKRSIFLNLDEIDRLHTVCAGQPDVEIEITFMKSELQEWQLTLGEMASYLEQATINRKFLIDQSYKLMRENLTLRYSQLVNQKLDDIASQIDTIFAVTELMDEFESWQISISDKGPARGMKSRYLQFHEAIQYFRSDLTKVESYSQRLEAIQAPGEVKRVARSRLKSLKDRFQEGLDETLQRGRPGFIEVQLAVVNETNKHREKLDRVCHAAIDNYLKLGTNPSESQSFAQKEAAYLVFMTECNDRRQNP